MRLWRALPWLLGLWLLVGNSFAATAECTYDQENQLEVLRKAAAREPGGRLDESQRRIVWSLPSGSTLTYTYGGCTHLGSEVTLAEPRRTARSETLLFARAMELATRFWDAADVAALRRGLQGRGFQREEANGRVYYRLAHEYYAEFFVAHEFADGVDRITIFWSRNF